MKKQLELIAREFAEEHFGADSNEAAASADRLKTSRNVFDELILRIFDESSDILHLANRVCAFYLDAKLPYIMAVNHLAKLQNTLTHMLLSEGNYTLTAVMYSRFDNIHHAIGSAYLKHYLLRLKSNNRVRLIRLGELIEKNVLNYYEAHLEWLDAVNDAVMVQEPDALPTSDPRFCAFGKWLNSDGKMLISNNSKFLALGKLHDELHQKALNIGMLMGAKEFRHLQCLSYLEKMELLSLEIGTELALIDSKMMVSKAAKDPLTGILNRSMLEQLFLSQYEIAIATGGAFTLAMCDLDHFKAINDTYGHIAGDQVLKAFASLLLSRLRSSDIIVRYGGEEFIIMLPATSYDIAVNILDKVRLALQDTPILFKEMQINATVSIGCVAIPPENVINDADALKYYIAEADANLYKAKREGRNRVR